MDADDTMLAAGLELHMSGFETRDILSQAIAFIAVEAISVGALEHASEAVLDQSLGELFDIGANLVPSAALAIARDGS